MFPFDDVIMHMSAATPYRLLMLVPNNKSPVRRLLAIRLSCSSAHMQLSNVVNWTLSAKTPPAGMGFSAQLGQSSGNSCHVIAMACLWSRAWPFHWVNSVWSGAFIAAQ